jgi:hypothetical protein
MQHYVIKFVSDFFLCDEVNELERIIGNRNNDIKELNIDLKDKDKQITSLSSKLKDKDKNVKVLQQQFSEDNDEYNDLYLIQLYVILFLAQVTSCIFWVYCSIKTDRHVYTCDVY